MLTWFVVTIFLEAETFTIVAILYRKGYSYMYPSTMNLMLMKNQKWFLFS